jgi:hypothetical protein
VIQDHHLVLQIIDILKSTHNEFSIIKSDIFELILKLIENFGAEFLIFE